jgi:hypothetical protein
MVEATKKCLESILELNSEKTDLWKIIGSEIVLRPYKHEHIVLE